MRLYNGSFSQAREWSSLINSVKCKVTRHQWRYVNSSPVFFPLGWRCFLRYILSQLLKSLGQITSRFDGVIKKLHYEAGDMAIVGKVCGFCLPFYNWRPGKLAYVFI